MKNVTDIPCPQGICGDAPRRNFQSFPSLKDRLMRGTAARLCPDVGIVSTQPIIMRGDVAALSELGRVQHRMARFIESAFGPLYVLYLHLLRLFGFDALGAEKLAELESIHAETEHLTNNAPYWQAAIHRMIIRAERVKARGGKFTPPEWFVWLARFDVSIAPARLKAVMAAWSVTGRVAVMGLESCASTPECGVSLYQLNARLCHAQPWPD